MNARLGLGQMGEDASCVTLHCAVQGRAPDPLPDIRPMGVVVVLAVLHLKASASQDAVTMRDQAALHFRH